jgi:hypothetical protein
MWRIDRLNGAAAKYLGVIVASDREMATEEACKKFGIIGPERLRLIVRELPCRRVFPVRRG